jgi:murein DD-endopeptidase MepM/ murein hydrolase activator NlpD
MYRKSICIISIILLFTNVDYAQLITINAFGKTINKSKSPQKDKVVVQPKVIDTINNNKMGMSNEDREYEFALPLGFLTVTSAFGQRFHPIYHCEKLHAGIDLRASYEVVYAFASGVVSQATYNRKSGNYITILHGAKGSLSSIYAHLNYLNVKVGEIVKAGQIIGISGSTGASTAPHLHFALKVDNTPIDPFPVLKLIIQCVRSHQLDQ